MSKCLIFGLTIVLAVVLTMPVDAQVTINNTYNFDDGTAMGFIRITRYDDDPFSTTSSASIPAAFPPPSTSYAICNADPGITYFGLASAVGGTKFDRSAPSFIRATLSGEIYCLASASTLLYFGLLGIDDTTLPTPEAYYVLQYRNAEVELRVFDGAAFTTLGNDATLDDTNMTIPGWNTFQMVFDGTETIHCTVNGATASFSPITDTQVNIDTQMQIGILSFDYLGGGPIYADDLSENIELAFDVDNWLLY